MGILEYLQIKGFKKVHQPKKRYNLSIEEIVSMLEEFAIKGDEVSIPDEKDIQQIKLGL